MNPAPTNDSNALTPLVGLDRQLFVGAAFMAARKRRPLAGGRKARPYEQLHGIALDPRPSEKVWTKRIHLASRASPFRVACCS